MLQLVQPSYVQAGKHCLFSGMKDISNYHGFKTNESDIFFYCQGMRFKYNESLKGSQRRFSEKLMLRPGEEYANEFARRLSATLHIFQCDNSQKTHEIIRSVLYDKKPVMVLAEPNILNYHPRQVNINIIGDYHCLVIYGIDEEENKYFIGDNYVVAHDRKICAHTDWIPIYTICNNIKGLFWLDTFPKTQDAHKVERSIVENINEFLLLEENQYGITGSRALDLCMCELPIYANINPEQKELIIMDFLYWLNAHFLCIFHYLEEYFSQKSNNDDECLVKESEKFRKKWGEFSVSLLRKCYIDDNFEGISQQGRHLLKEQEDYLKQIMKYLRNE